MTPSEAKLVKAAQKYDLVHRHPLNSWTRVPDDQVLRLLTGARLAKAEADTPPANASIADHLKWSWNYIRENYGTKE